MQQPPSLPPGVPGKVQTHLRMSVSKMVWRTGTAATSTLIARTTHAWFELTWWGLDRSISFFPVHVNSRIQSKAAQTSIRFPITSTPANFAKYLDDVGDLELRFCTTNACLGVCNIPKKEIAALTAKPRPKAVNKMFPVCKGKQVIGDLHVILVLENVAQPENAVISLAGNQLIEAVGDEQGSTADVAEPITTNGPLNEPISIEPIRIEAHDIQKAIAEQQKQFETDMEMIEQTLNQRPIREEAQSKKEKIAEILRKAEILRQSMIDSIQQDGLYDSHEEEEKDQSLISSELSDDFVARALNMRPLQDDPVPSDEASLCSSIDIADEKINLISKLRTHTQSVPEMKEEPEPRNEVAKHEDLVVVYKHISSLVVKVDSIQIKNRNARGLLYSVEASFPGDTVPNKGSSSDAAQPVKPLIGDTSTVSLKYQREFPLCFDNSPQIRQFLDTFVHVKVSAVPEPAKKRGTTSATRAIGGKESGWIGYATVPCNVLRNGLNYSGTADLWSLEGEKSRFVGFVSISLVLVDDRFKAKHVAQPISESKPIPNDEPIQVAQPAIPRQITLFQIEFSRIKLSLVPESEKCLVSLGFKLFSPDILVESPPVLYDPVLRSVNGVSLPPTNSLDFNFSCPLSISLSLLQKIQRVPLFVEVWQISFPQNVAQQRQLVGIVKVPVSLMFMAFTDTGLDAFDAFVAQSERALVLPQREYPIVDVLSGATVGWISIQVLFGTWSQLHRKEVSDDVRGEDLIGQQQMDENKVDEKEKKENEVSVVTQDEEQDQVPQDEPMEPEQVSFDKETQTVESIIPITGNESFNESKYQPGNVLEEEQPIIEEQTPGQEQTPEEDDKINFLVGVERAILHKLSNIPHVKLSISLEWHDQSQIASDAVPESFTPIWNFMQMPSISRETLEIQLSKPLLIHLMIVSADGTNQKCGTATVDVSELTREKREIYGWVSLVGQGLGLGESIGEVLVKVRPDEDMRHNSDWMTSDCDEAEIDLEKEEKRLEEEEEDEDLLIQQSFLIEERQEIVDAESQGSFEHGISIGEELDESEEDEEKQAEEEDFEYLRLMSPEMDTIESRALLMDHYECGLEEESGLDTIKLLGTNEVEQEQEEKDHWKEEDPFALVSLGISSNLHEFVEEGEQKATGVEKKEEEKKEEGEKEEENPWQVKELEPAEEPEDEKLQEKEDEKQEDTSYVINELVDTVPDQGELTIHDLSITNDKGPEEEEKEQEEEIEEQSFDVAQLLNQPKRNTSRQEQEAQTDLSMSIGQGQKEKKEAFTQSLFEPERPDRFNPRIRDQVLPSAGFIEWYRKWKSSPTKQYSGYTKPHFSVSLYSDMERFRQTTRRDIQRLKRAFYHDS